MCGGYGKEIESEELCDYGCGNRANYIFKNGKLCCCKTFNKCLAVKNKNRLGVKKSNVKDMILLSQ